MQGTIVTVLVSALGSAVTRIRLDNCPPEHNPDTPTQNEDEYVDDAIKCWARKPTVGPAYRILWC